MNRFKATLAIATVSLLALTACGGDATKVTEGAKDAVDQTAKTATEGVTKAGEGAMKAGDAAKDAAGGVATKAGEGAMKAGDAAKDAVGGVATKAGEGAMKAGDAAKDAVGGVATKAGDAASKVATSATGAAGLLSLTQSIPGLKTSATAALDAVKKGDFKGAQAEATKLQESWGKVSDVVKTKSGGSFDKISSTLKTVQTELKEPSPNKDKIISDLTSLSSSVAGLASIK